MYVVLYKKRVVDDQYRSILSAVQQPNNYTKNEVPAQAVASSVGLFLFWPPLLHRIKTQENNCSKIDMESESESVHNP